MHLIAFHPSAVFARLKWAACGASLLVAGWLALVPSTGWSWVAAVAALLPVAAAWRIPAAQGRLRLRPEGGCELFEAIEGGKPAAMGVTGAFSAAGWLVLRLRAQGTILPGRGPKTRLLVLPPDAASPEELRQLRVWLRLAAPRALNSGDMRWS